MQELFDNIEPLDISLLTGKKEETTDNQQVRSGTTGRFSTEADEPKFEKPEAIKVEGVAKVEAEVETETTEAEIVEETAEVEQSPVKMISSFLKEEGIADFTDEEFRDDDKFIAEVVGRTIDKKSAEGIQAYKDELPAEIKALIESYEDGVPLGQLLESEQKTYELSVITPEKIKEDSRLQEDLVESYMLSTGWSKEETNDRIKELQDAGIIEKEAIRAHGKLVQLEKANKDNALLEVKNSKLEAQKKYENTVKQLQTTINNKKEFFENIATNDNEKKQVFDAITKYDKTGRNKISQLLADPEMYLKTAYFLEVLKGDLSKIKTTATTAAVNGLKKKIDAPIKTESRFGGKNLEVLNGFLKSKQTFLQK